MLQEAVVVSLTGHRSVTSVYVVVIQEDTTSQYFDTTVD